MRPFVRARGLSLIEVVFSVSLLSVVFMSLFASLMSSSELSAASSEDVVALEAAQNTIEQLKATPFASVFATYYTPTGKTFPVKGLGPGATGRITFLSEAVYAAVTGKSVDLDFDGAITDSPTTPSSRCTYFPVQVTITWRSRSNRSATAPPRTLTITSAIFNAPGTPGQ